MKRWFAEDVLDEAGVLICINDSSDNIMLFNKVAERISGCKKEEVLGRSFLDLLHEDYRDRARKRREDAFKEGRFPREPIEFPIKTNAGTKLLEWRSTILKGEKGEVKGSMSVGIDITERKKAENQINNYIQDLAFLANTAMEFVEFGIHEDAHNQIAEKITEMVPHSLVCTVSFDDNGEVTIETLQTKNPDFTGCVEDIVGDLKGKRFRLTERVQHEFEKGHLISAALSDELVIGDLDSVSEKWMGIMLDEHGIEKIHYMGLVKDEVLFGGVVIFPLGERYLESPAVLETFINQASIALQKKAAERDLEDSHSRLLTVLNSLDAMVYVVDMDTYEILFLNDFGHAIWGGVEGKKCWETLQNNMDGPCPFCTNHKLVDDSGSPTGVYRWEFKNTVAEKWFDCRDRAIEWIDGRTVRIEVATDITERKHVEEVLIDSEERSRILLEAIPDLVFRIDSGGVFLDYKSNEEDLYAVNGEILGKNVRELMPEHVADITEKAIAGALETGELQRYEYALDMPNGKREFYESRLAVIAEDELIAIVRQVTEQVEAERELRESRDTFSDILDSESAGIYRIKVRPKNSWAYLEEIPYSYMFMNDRYCELTGLTREEHEADPATTLRMIHPDDYEDFARKNEEASEDMTPFHWEGRAIVNGQERWFNFYSHPRECEDGCILWTGMLIDVTEQKAAEAERKEADRRLRDMLENIDLVAVVLDADGNIVFCNDFLLNLTGWTKKEALGKNWFDNFTDEENVKEFFLQSMAKGDISPHFENHILTKDGGKRLISWSNTILKDSNGNITGTTSIGKDVTEQKAAEEALRESEEKFRSIVSNIPGAVYRCANDADWTMEYLSEQQEEITGFPSSDFTSGARAYASIMHPDDRKMVDETVATAIEKRAPYSIEYRIVHKDGDVRWVGESGRCVFDEKNNFLHLDGVIVDITEYKNMVDEIETQKERYRAIFENAPLGILTLSSTGDIIDINQAVLEIFGGDRDYAMGINVLEFPPFTEAGISEDVKNCLENGVNASYQRPYTTTKGKDVILRYTVAPIRDKDGNITAVQAILEDVKKYMV